MPSILKLLTGCALFIGLPMTGWGWDDVGGFVHHPARLAYLLTAFLLQAILVFFVPTAGRTGGEGKETVSRQRWAILALQILSLGLLLAAPFCDRRGILTAAGSDAFRYSGTVFFAAGFGLMNWAEVTLGRLFSIQVTIQKDHQLITSGVFRHIRHPRYLGILLFNLGIALVFNNWIGFILVAVLAAVLIWRIHDEEHLMRREFGAEWDVYVRKSRRLIPWLY
jgi:protein-S-isoprenylcysteine O-methyltransferase Ste14